MIDIDEVKDRLIAKYSAEDIIEQLQPDVEDVVEGLHEFIVLNWKRVVALVDHDCEDGYDL